MNHNDTQPPCGMIWVMLTEYHTKIKIDFTQISISTVLPHLYPPLIVYQYKSTSFVSHSDISLSPKFYGPDFPCSIINYYVIPHLYPHLYYMKYYAISIYGGWLKRGNTEQLH